MGLIHFTKGMRQASGEDIDGVFCGLGDLHLPVSGVIERINPDYMTYISTAILPFRKLGVYEHGNAECTVGEQKISEDKWGYRLDFKFTSVGDAQELDRMIRAGTILPAISYDNPQIPALPAFGFTLEEIAVSLLLMKAKNDREIARVLGVSESTVSRRVISMFKKTGTASRLQLVLKLIYSR